MSQSSFLEDVVSWSAEECQQRHEEAVPKLVSFFKQAENYHGEVGVLKILCQCFVPCMDWSSLERCVFREITPQTCASYDKVIEDVKSEVSSPGNSQAKENVEALFELLLDVLDCVEGTVRYIQGADNSVELGHIHSLQLLTLHLLKTTFSHCKDSGEIYKDLITALSDPLSVLFRKAYSLQMTFLSLLDKLSIGFTVTDEDIEDLTAVCEGLYSISRLVTTLDIKIAVTLWKAISRCVTQHKVLLRERLDLAGMVIYLCAEIQRGYTYLFTLAPQVDQFGQVSTSQGDEKAFMKSLKILGFQMKVLVMLVKEYEGYLADCERPIYILLLQLHRMQPPSLSAPSLQKGLQEEIHRHLLNATEPIMSHLLECSRFITCLTGDETDGAPDTALAHLLLQITSLSLLPQLSDDVQEKWLTPSQYSGDEPRQGIIDAIFTACEKCHTELLLGGSLPGVMCSGKAQRFVSLYEHVCTRLCGYVGSLSAKQFPVVESSLLRHVLHSDPLCNQMATDIWCFVARYGSADLCLSHVTLLGEMLKLAPPTQAIEYRAVLRLLGRLTKFMAPEHQEKLLDIFPEESLYVWSGLPLSDFPVPLQTRILNDLLPKCTRYLTDWNGRSERKFSDLKTLNSALEVTCNIFKHEAGVQEGLDSSLTQSFMHQYCSLWSCLPDLRDPHCRASVICHKLVNLSLELGSYVIKYLPSHVFHQAVEMSGKLLQEKCPLELKLSICQFLQQAGKVKLPPMAEQTAILCCVSRLFSVLLADAHCLVQHSACQAYSSFSQESIHEISVPECLQSDPRLQDKLSRHLYQIGLLEMESERKLELLKSLKTELEKFKQMAPEERITTYTTTMNASEEKLGKSSTHGDILVDGSDTKMDEPAAKKLKLDLSSEQLEADCAKLLEDTHGCIQRWVELLRVEQVPHGILNQLRKASKDLSEAVSNQHEHD